MPKSFDKTHTHTYIYAFSCFAMHVILINFVQIMATNLLNIFSFGIWFKFIALITLNQILTIFLHNPFKFSYHICHHNITKLWRYFILRMFDWFHSFFHFSKGIFEISSVNVCITNCITCSFFFASSTLKCAIIAQIFWFTLF